MKIPTRIRQLLRERAAQYENSDFLLGDPSWFMHQVQGTFNQEATAFVASCLSYGSREQFMPKIAWLLDCAKSDMDSWIREGRFHDDLPAHSQRCFYRLFTVERMNRFLSVYQRLMLEYGSLGQFLQQQDVHSGQEALAAICGYFGNNGISGLIPKDTQSACKRACMFLRWMVRDNSPVDLGLWSSFIDKRTLIIPLDTHVLSQAKSLGLIQSNTPSFATAVKLTNALATIFPDDPLRGDFALFGYGITHDHIR